MALLVFLYAFSANRNAKRVIENPEIQQMKRDYVRSKNKEKREMKDQS